MQQLSSGDAKYELSRARKESTSANQIALVASSAPPEKNPSKSLKLSCRCITPNRTPLKRTDKGAGPSGREVISLQKEDSLLVFLM
jgi:hypothetical protein